jgi:hypothetical protein
MVGLISLSAKTSAFLLNSCQYKENYGSASQAGKHFLLIGLKHKVAKHVNQFFA